MQEQQTLRSVLLREVARHYHTKHASCTSAKQAAQHRWSDSFAAVLLAQQQNIAALMAALQVRIQAP